MERKRFCSFILVLVLLLTMLPVGVYAEDPEGTARVSSQGEFNLALADGSVNHIIAESVELDIQQGTELTKDLTITSTAGLRISDNGLFIVYSDVTLNVDGYIVVRQNGELRVGGTLVNNGMVNVGGVLSAAAPAVIQNNGLLAISDDPAIGEGLISFIDILSDTESESLVVTLAGSVPEVTGGAIKRTADVNGPASLAYALADPQYNGIWFTEFHDATGQTTGAAMIYPGDLTITKPLDIFDNDEMLVTGNLTVQGPEGSLYIGGDLTVAGNFANSGDMFIDGSLTLGGTASNSAYYTQSAEAVVNGIITDVGDGDHMRGYYVTDQAGWEMALSDSAHCNPIVIGAEAVSGSAIAVTTDTAITSNLFVEGDLIIGEGTTFTVGMRYDGDANGVSNDVMGALINNGTLELIVPFAVSGTLVNNGTVWTAAYNGDEYGQNWTEDGSILLYTWRDEAEVLPARSGHLENNGLILNDSTIAINDGATAFNSPAGLIEGGAISNWWDFAPENTFPLINEGIIRFADIDQKINYTHLAYRDLDNTGSGWYENPEYGYGYELSCQPGNQYYGLFGLWDYDGVSETWGFTAVTPGALSVSSGGGIALAPLDPSQISANPAHDTHNSGSYASMTVSQWGDFEVSYTDSAEGRTWRLSVTADLPELGFYTLPEATRENFITGFSRPYTPDAGDSFYAVVKGNYSEGWTSNFEIRNGEGRAIEEPRIKVEATTDPAIYQVAVNPETRGNFGFKLWINLQNTATGDHREPEWWIDLYEAETEGLVFNRPDWRGDPGEEYPIVSKDGEGNIRVETRMDVAIGGFTAPLFFRHLVGDEWVLDPVDPAAVTTTSGSGITVQEWSAEGYGEIIDTDYTNYRFAEIGLSQFGTYELTYTTGSGIYTLPVSVTLPGVAFYSAPEATQENYIGEYSYGTVEAQRQFYLIAAPNADIDPEWTNDVLVHEGNEYVTITPTLDKEEFLVTVKPDVTGTFRLRAEIRYFDGENQMWQSDRDIMVSEEPVEGLVFNWAEWRGARDSEYPAVTKDGNGNIVAETQMNVAIGGLTAPFFYRHLDGAEWVLTPVSPAAIVIPSGSGITIRTWNRDPFPPEANADEDYTDHLFAEITFDQFGQFELSYDAGEGPMTLPVTVGLPDAGFYSAAAAAEENYINEFHYDNESRSFYFIASTDMTVGPDWTAEVEILDGAGRVDVATTGALGVFLVTVSEATEGDARFHGKIRYFDGDHAEQWQADRDILLYEAEEPGLVYCWVDWKNAENINYPALTGEPPAYGSRIDTSKGNYVFAFFYKHWEGDEATGDWAYTPVLPDQLIVTTESGITRTVWTHENIGNIPADDGQYFNYVFTDIGFPALGDFTIGYQVGETLYQMTAHIALPGLGAYTASGGGEENWLPEVAFDELRSVYLVPTADLSTMDLSRSTFYLPDGAGEIPYTYDVGTKTFSKAGYGSIAAHETEGVVDYFTMDISALPFDPDFDLGLRLRDGDGQELVGTTIRFVSSMQDADAQDSGAPLAAPGAAGEEKDTSAALPAVPAGSIRWASFTAGDPGANGHLFKLAGVCPGARLYLFDSDWILLKESNHENLNDRTADIWTTELTGGAVYYLAARNESDAAWDLTLSAGLRAIPEAPSVSDPFFGTMYTMGVNVSGASEGQHYILYAKIDGQWRKGDEPYDAGNEPRFIHLFDFLQSGETAQSIGVAIGSDGIESSITERAVTVVRQDGLGAEGAHVQLMAQISEGSDNAALRLTGGSVFASETYYRLHHEKDSGEWDYNASFFGDGTDVALGGAQIDPAGISEGGRWVLAKYRSVGEGATYTECWDTLVDTGESFGSLQRLDFDLFHATPDMENNRVDLSVEIRSQKPAESRAVDLFYALYDSQGRLIDLGLRPKSLGTAGLDDGVSISFDPANRPAQCKVFVLNEGCGPETETLVQSLRFDD